MATTEVIKQLQVKNATGYNSPVYLGSEARFVGPTLNSSLKNLEEELILNRPSRVEYTYQSEPNDDLETDFGVKYLIITKYFYEGDSTTSNYYKLTYTLTRFICQDASFANYAQFFSDYSMVELVKTPAFGGVTTDGDGNLVALVTYNYNEWYPMQKKELVYVDASGTETKVLDVNTSLMIDDNYYFYTKDEVTRY